MATILYTSLAEIKSFHPCASGWRNILIGQGKSVADDVLFPLIDCLNSNPISDVCWLLGKRKNEIDICANFARKCANSVSHLKNKYATAAAAADYADYATTYATYAATYATYAADYATAATYAKQKQTELNKQFLIECIKEWEESY
jgi:hypothetical protein